MTVPKVWPKRMKIKATRSAQEKSYCGSAARVDCAGPFSKQPVSTHRKKNSACHQMIRIDPAEH